MPPEEDPLAPSGVGSEVPRHGQVVSRPEEMPAMSEHLTTSFGDPLPRPAALAGCRWLVVPPSLYLACAVHGPRAPWYTPSGCAAGPATLCQVCLRQVVPCAGPFSWTLLCPTCTRIETRLARPFGVAGLTPHTGQSDTQAETLFALQFPDRVRGPEVVERRRQGGATWVSATHQAPDVSPLHLPLRHAGAELVLLGCTARGPVTGWLDGHPASARASAAAYQRYAAEQHAWLLAAIPRVDGPALADGDRDRRRDRPAVGEVVPSSVELRWRPDDHQAAFTFSS